MVEDVTMMIIIKIELCDMYENNTFHTIKLYSAVAKLKARDNFRNTLHRDLCNKQEQNVSGA